jgi:hypothetical protein
MLAMERAVSRSAVFTRWTGNPVERSDADSKVSPPQGRQCRKLLAIATVPEVCAQLELWARDFDDEAVKAELTRRPS